MRTPKQAPQNLKELRARIAADEFLRNKVIFADELAQKQIKSKRKGFIMSKIRDDKAVKASSHYTLGRVVGEVFIHKGNAGKDFLTVRVRLIGGMTVSAYVGLCDVVDGRYVCVKVTPKENGFTAYNCCPLSVDTKDFVSGVYSQILRESDLPF